MNNWYSVNEVMLLLNVGKSKAYEYMRSFADEIEKTKIPGKDRCYARPPSGQVNKDFFCEKFMLDKAECDKFIKNRKREMVK